MGNAQSIIENMNEIQTLIADMNDSEKLNFLSSKGIVNDELLQLYRNGTMSSKDIESVVFESINKNKHK